VWIADRTSSGRADRRLSAISARRGGDRIHVRLVSARRPRLARRHQYRLGVFGHPIPSGISIDNIVTGGGGGGYKAGWFRADVTFDYSGRARFSTTAKPNGVYDAKVDTLVGLANVYLDLGTWSGITPYIGAGAGVANFWMHSYEAPNGPINPDKQSKADFAWAYMAGVAWCFAPRWSVDLAYRRLNFGETTFNPHLVNSLTLKDMTANEFRIGLRYNFD
jgi:opacity protein-like surface antigen